MAERKYRRTTYRKRGGIVFFIFKILIFIIFLGGLGAVSLFFYYVKDFPRPEKFTEREIPQSTKIYDRTGEVLLYEIYGEEKRTWSPFKEFPDFLKNAVIATEDANFYRHYGIDPKGITRSVLTDLRIGRPTYGGSTIPQQLIRSTFLSIEKTAQRKIREIILAIELDRRYQKDQILEWYLNQVPFGRNSYGVEAASQTYFGKKVSEISLAQAATLAALIQAPSRLSSEENREDLLIRRNYVLDRMEQLGFTKKEDAQSAKKEEIVFLDFSQMIKAPHFVLWVKKTLEDKYGEDFLRIGGLKINTSLDWEIQQLAEKILEEGAKKNRAYNAYNAAMVVISPKTGEVLSLIGSADYFGESYPKGCVSGRTCLFDPKFNVAVGTEKNPGRQPGSSFKPFVYVTAFQKGYSDKEIIMDASTSFGVWGGKEYSPQNYDGRFRGPVTLRQSLAQSLNVPSVKILLDLSGLDASIETAKNLGINTLSPPYGPSIVLGGWEVKLLEITSAYSVFANNGLRIPPLSILKIEDKEGNVVEESKKTPKRVISSEAAILLNDVLSDNDARTPVFGARSPLYFEGYDVAAKTGTTQDYRDGWIIGYTPFITIGVWTGNNNNAPMSKEPGSVMAGPIFHELMRELLLKYPKENFVKPETKEDFSSAISPSLASTTDSL